MHIIIGVYYIITIVLTGTVYDVRGALGKPRTFIYPLHTIHYNIFVFVFYNFNNSDV